MNGLLQELQLAILELLQQGVQQMPYVIHTYSLRFVFFFWGKKLLQTSKFEIFTDKPCSPKLFRESHLFGVEIMRHVHYTFGSVEVPPVGLGCGKIFTKRCDLGFDCFDLPQEKLREGEC